MPSLLSTIIRHTQAWVRRAVIGLNLCPFAKAPEVKALIRYAVSDAVDARQVLESLEQELTRLVDADPAQLETTLLILPQAFPEFATFSAFIPRAEKALRKLGLEGVIQVASFHPQYQFAEAAFDDLGNATNRAPYPILHLLREDSITRAVDAIPEPEAIYLANIRRLRELGADGWQALMAQCAADAEGGATGLTHER